MLLFGLVEKLNIELWPQKLVRIKQLIQKLKFLETQQMKLYCDSPLHIVLN